MQALNLKIGDIFEIEVLEIDGVTQAVLSPKRAIREPGSLQGKIEITESFDAPLPNDIQSAFEDTESLQLLDKCCADNPELPRDFVASTLKARKEQEEGMLTDYEEYKKS